MAQVVALSGFMGSGKSSIGRIVACRLGRRFIDLDEYVEQREGASIQDLFLKRGEAGFRKAEAEALADVLGGESGERVVLALGGGTVTWPDSARLLAAGAFVVLISVPVGDLWQRVREYRATSGSVQGRLLRTCADTRGGLPYDGRLSGRGGRSQSEGGERTRS